MPVSRRTAMTAIGGIVLGYGTASAVGAFDEIELERDLDVEVAPDAEGLLELEDNDKRDSVLVVDTDEDGQITIGLEEEDALTDGTVTNFHEVLVVRNNGETPINLDIVGVTDTGTSETVVGYTDDDPSDRPIALDPGPVEFVGFQFDLEGEHDLDAIDAVRFTATPQS